MFEVMRKKIEDFGTSAEMRLFLDETLTRIQSFSPEAVQNMTLTDLMPNGLGIGNSGFSERLMALNLLVSSPEPVLSAFLCIRGPDGDHKRMTRVECRQALNRESGIHPFTKSPISDMSSIAYMTYALRPEFVLSHLLYHDPDVRVLIAETPERAQDYSLMGVPTLFFPPLEEQRDYAFANIMKAAQSGQVVIAMKGAFLDSFRLPRPYTIRPLPGESRELTWYVDELAEKVTPWTSACVEDLAP